MKKSVLKSTILLFALITISSCKKDNNKSNNPTPTPAPVIIKSAKFEITGNYTGYFSIIYSDNVSGNTTVTVTTLP